MTTSTIIKFLKNCKGFDVIAKNVNIKSAEKGQCLASLLIEEEHTNRFGMLHKGFCTALVDIISSYALFTVERGAVPSVSVDINMNFIKEARVGDVINVDAKVIRCGKTLAFLNVDISNEANGDMLMNGTHTKFLLK